MTDLRTLLNASAPTPTRPLDMRAVRRRAQRTRARRALAWLGAIGVLVGIGVPTGGALLSPADRSRVDAIDGDRAIATTTSVVGEVDDSSEVAPDSNSSEGASEAGQGVVGGDPGSPLLEHPTTTRSTARPRADAYPRAAGCSVNDDGLAEEESRVCRFTATTRGNAYMRTDGGVHYFGVQPDGRVTVTRAGVSTTYQVGNTGVTAEDPNGEEAAVFAGCGSNGTFIEPGDLVEVVLTRTSSTEPTATTVLTAGEWQC